jgi:hypothetical protein
MMMRRIPVEMTTVSSDGEHTTETVDFMLLPPNPEAAGCPLCGAEHQPHEPHNRDSLHYNYDFLAQHGRWPTWRDAVAHCDPEVQARWLAALTQKGVNIDAAE